MEIDFCNKIFGNLYSNKIVFHERITVFCEVVECSFNNDILTLKLKVIEPVVEVKAYLRHFYETLKNKEYFQVSTRFNENRFLELDKQKINAPYCPFSIWANYDLVKKVCELKEQGREQEIYETLWEKKRTHNKQFGKMAG